MEKEHLKILAANKADVENNSGVKSNVKCHHKIDCPHFTSAQFHRVGDERENMKAVPNTLHFTSWIV